jgi:enamine deaminase RidA (YjgF/YER057c/UK114 family)
MDTKSRRRFVNNMMAATAMAMGGPMLTGQDYTRTGGVQKGPDGSHGNPPPGSPAGSGAARQSGRGARPQRPRPGGIVWVSGQGSNDGVPTEKQISVTAPFQQHVRRTMDALKRAVERLGGTMDSVLYVQVFFCLPLDDNTPMPTGSAAAAAYQKRYIELNAIYDTYWTGTYGPPPRSCFALSWNPGNSLVEVVGAAYIDDGDA